MIRRISPYESEDGINTARGSSELPRAVSFFVLSLIG